MAILAQRRTVVVGWSAGHHLQGGFMRVMAGCAAHPALIMGAHHPIAGCKSRIAVALSAQCRSVVNWSRLFGVIDRHRVMACRAIHTVRHSLADRVVTGGMTN